MLRRAVIHDIFIIKKARGIRGYLESTADWSLPERSATMRKLHDMTPSQQALAREMAAGAIMSDN